MSDLNCRLSQEQITQQFQVGSKLVYVCEPLKPDLKIDEFNWTQAQFILSPETKYQIRLLKGQVRSPQEVELTVTSYVPGDYRWPELKLSDQKSTLQLNELSFQVQSVIDPQNPEKEPFGPMGPFELSFPVQFAIAIGFVFLFFMTLIILKVRRVFQKRALVSQITKDPAVQKPLPEFSSVVRKLKKDYSLFDTQIASELEISECFEKLDSAYRRFLVRRLMVPAHVWSQKQILKDVRSNLKDFYQQHFIELKSVLTELGRFKKTKKRTALDLIQLVDMSQKSVEKMDGYFQQQDSQKGMRS